MVVHSTETSERSLLRDRNLHIIFSITLMVVMGVASIAPALPAIVRDLGISKLDVAWLITAFSLPGMLLAPFVGVFADRFGRKRILVPAIFLFAIAGTACAFTRDFNILLIFRVFQGIGAAAMGSINVTLIGDLYSGRRRVEAMGLNASVLSLGAAGYPLIGGALAAIAWYYPFYLSLIAIPIGIIVLTKLNNPEPDSREDFKSYLVGAWGYLKNMKVAALFAAGVITFIIVFGAYLTYFAIYMDDAFNVSGFTIGVFMSVSALAAAVVASQMGRITRRISEGMLIKVSFAIFGLSLILIPLMPSLWLLLIPVLLLGIAQGINLPSILSMAAGLAPTEYRAAFMSINSSMIRLGQTVGPPIVGLFYVYGGPTVAFAFTAGLAFMASAVGLFAGRFYNIIFGRKKACPRI
ncbi:MAG: MFS transporter [Dehalococcoidia bacterium]|nr:MFS transporter [Dehalococcoidia bacterium]